MTTQSQRIVWMTGLGLFLATPLDIGIINIALPTLQTTWHTTAATVAWTVAAYTVTLADTVLFWGRLADRIGPGRVFWWGLMGFAVTSGACGMAPSLGWLIAARALQGLASAMIQGTAIALATVHLPTSRRALALGTLAMFQGLGAVIGPTVSGVLLTWVSWRGLFWINLPVSVPLILWLGPRSNTQAAPANPPSSLDIPGNVFLMVAVFTGLLALTGQSGSRLLWIVISVLAVGCFLRWERRTPSPLIPRALWSSPMFWAVWRHGHRRRRDIPRVYGAPVYVGASLGCRRTLANRAY